MLEKIKNEPARVVAVVLAIIGLASAFGLNVSDDQTSAVVAFVAAILALVGGEAVRAKVTPTRKLGEDGAADTCALIMFATLLGVVLLLFGVRLG